jgi:ComF family protein
MWMIYALPSILFPPSCLGCKKSATALCERCIGLSRKSLSAMHPFILSTFDFKDPLIKRVIHAIKYHHRKDLVDPLIPYIAQTASIISPISDYTLVPIPMPRLRRLMRGYNQSDIIARALSKQLHIPCDMETLIRTKNKKRQATIHEKQKRLENQKGTFAVTGSVQGKRFILVDDVTTTGATLAEARKELLRAGAQEVLALTIAH